MQKLSLVQQIALESDLDMMLSKARHKAEELVECFFILSCTPGEIIDNCLNIMRDRLDSEMVDKIMLNVNTLTVPYELLADRAVQDIYLLKGNCKTATTRGAMFNVANKESMIKGKLISYLRCVKDSSEHALDIIIEKIDSEFPEYKDIIMMFRKSSRIFESEDDGTSINMSGKFKLIESIIGHGLGSSKAQVMEFQRESSLFFISLFNIDPINFSNEYCKEIEGEEECIEDEDLKETGDIEDISEIESYITEVRDETGTIVKRRTFETLVEAQEYKRTMEKLNKDSKKKLSVKLIYSFRKDMDESDEG